MSKLDELMQLDWDIGNYNRTYLNTGKYPENVNIFELEGKADVELRLPKLLEVLLDYYRKEFDFKEPRVSLKVESGKSLFSNRGSGAKVIISITDRRANGSQQTKIQLPPKGNPHTFDHIRFSRSDFSTLSKLIDAKQFIDNFNQDSIQKVHSISRYSEDPTARFELEFNAQNSVYNRIKQIKALCELGQLPRWFLYLGTKLPLDPDMKIALCIASGMTNGYVVGESIINLSQGILKEDSLAMVGASIRKTKDFRLRAFASKFYSDKYDKMSLTKLDKKIITWADLLAGIIIIESENSKVPKKFSNKNKNIDIFSLPLLLNNFKRAIPKNFDSGREELNKRVHPLLAIMKFKYTPMFAVHLASAIKAMNYNINFNGIQDPNVKLLIDYTINPTQNFSNKKVIQLTSEESINRYSDKSLMMYLLSIINVAHHCDYYLSQNDQRIIDNISAQLDSKIAEIHKKVGELYNYDFRNSQFVLRHEKLADSAEGLPNWPTL